MAKQMRACIHKDFQITASAGISCNKLISKICSDLKKPNNQYCICDDEIPNFIKNIRLNKLPGIGKVNFNKCKNLNMEYCKDMYNYPVDDLVNIFGVYGNTLYNFIRGIDNRNINISRVRKSMSVEDTFLEDLNSTEVCISKINHLYEKLIERCKINNVPQNLVKEIFIKIKFNNFQSITRQSKCSKLDSKTFIQLFTSNINVIQRPIRLLGLGFTLKDKEQKTIQYDIFNR
jgi:DNA polymerase-4